MTSITRRALKLKELELIDPDINDGLFTLPPEPPIRVVAGPDPDVIVTDPVALGTGSDELWRRKKGKPQPAQRRQ